MISRKSAVLLLILFITPVIIYLIWPSDESRIRKLFRKGAPAIEREMLDDVMAAVSFNYRDEQGLTYLSVKEGMRKVFQRMDNIKVEYEITGIDVTATTATALLDVRIIASYGTDTGYFMGDAAHPAHLTFFLEKERGGWLVTKAQGMQAAYH